MPNIYRNNLFYTAAISALLMSSATGYAATESSGESLSSTSQIEEIIVTAQKRSERIQDVPMSITAETGTELLKQGITDTSQLTKLVPGFNYQQGAFGVPVFSIRGVGFYDNTITANPTVTVYVDQVPLPYSAQARGAMLDLERVEVLKGPQGTLFGMNSTGGAINYIAAKPGKTFAAGFDMSYGNYNATNLSGFISGPINDTLTARLAVSHEGRGGWQQSATRPGDTLGTKNFTNARLLVDWKPSDQLSFELNISGWHDGSDSQAAQFEGFSPAVAVTPLTQFIADGMQASPIAANKATAADWDAGKSFKRDDNFYHISLRGDWQINDKLTLTSITAYSHLKSNGPFDVDGSAFTNFYVKSRQGLLQSFSQELRLAGTIDKARWMIGANYQNDVATENQFSNNQGTNSVIGPFLFTAFRQEIDQRPKTKSVFGSIDYALTDAISAQGSVRYTDQRRKFKGCVADGGVGPVGTDVATAFSFLSTIFSGTPTSIPPGGCATLDATTFKPALATSDLNEHNLSWRLGLNWKTSADGMLYANVSKGYKSGSYSLLPAILSSQFAPVTQESAIAYEAGFKQIMLDRKLDMTAAIFYDDYKNKQLLGYVLSPVFGTLPQLVNIPKSEIYGAELNMTVYPTKGLRIKGGGTYLFSKVKEDPLAPAVPRDPFGNLTSYVGEKFPNTPRWQAVGDVEYAFPLSGTSLGAFIGGSLSYRGQSYAGFGNSAAFKLNSYVLVDLRAGINSEDGHWTAQVWGRNITNKYYWTNVSHLTDYVSRLAGMPATYGLSLSYRY